MTWLRVDVYDASGNRRAAGPLARVESFRYAQRLDEVGSFELVIPAEEARAAIVQQGDELRFFREGEGEVFRGLVESMQDEVGADGRTVLSIAGASVARQLVWANTLLGRAYEGETLADSVADLLDGSGWTAGEVATPATLLTARFDGLSTWSALSKVAETFGLHVRERSTGREIDLAAFGGAAGIVLQNVPLAGPALERNPRLYPIAGLTVGGTSADVWNSIIPLGAGEGVNQLTLAYSDRTVAGGHPYDVSSATGPAGKPYYYLEDAASVAAHGRRIKPVVVSGISPLDNSLSGFRAAANALYDVAATWLQRHRVPLTSYAVTAVGLRGLIDGAPAFEVGDRMRLVYRGIVQEGAVRRAWRSVDEQLWLMGYERTFDAGGADTWTLTLSTVDRQQEDAVVTIARTFEEFHGLQVALKPYTYREMHGPTRQSVDSGHPVVFRVNFDANIAQIHQAKLTVAVRPVRSNAKAAAYLGEVVPFGTTNSDGSHQHANGGITLEALALDGEFHYHGMDTFTNTGLAGAHTHGFGLPDHQHPLEYGIFDGPAPSTPGITLHINSVNVTSALGGPWNGDFEVDITDYLRDGNGQPLRQQNVIQLTSTELLDFEVACRSLVTSSSLQPV